MVSFTTFWIILFSNPIVVALDLNDRASAPRASSLRRIAGFNFV